ncbi:hypothetical protein [Halobacterium jilantaiense]|uniref:Uncharacterized protein n=1 Tax=Halobacterium jilantaiense TaxID=355548 RepID=A0A1I0Q950_9EURY|nr:hypothetical protein [Halobacterium jilantaiense]SEW23555.1 hypothetical protein SAMN04487945_2398 [Halobacterium jilantaiense]
MTDERGDASTSASTNAAADTGVSLTAAVSSAWSTVKTVYWANSPSWRVLKSGALVFLGFFVWAGSNILYSYNGSLDALHYPMAYGFLLIGYGPVHHLVVIPLALKWRRSDGLRATLGKRLPNGMLVAFVAAILVLGTFPAGAMTVDFQSQLGDGSADVDPELSCVKTTGGDARVDCELASSEGVGRVVVESGGETVRTVEDPPYEFSLSASEVGEIVGEKQFTVRLEDEDGTFVRRYTRRLAVVPEATE